MAQKLGKKARFLKEHPYCCFCGGGRPAVTVDHVPPKACFPVGFSPEGFEFPACEACNNGTSQFDSIFGLYSLLGDFRTHTPDDIKRIEKLRYELGKRYPDAFSDPSTHFPIHRAGSIITPVPVAFSVGATPLVQQSIEKMGEKLTHALFYREMGKPLTPDYRFMTSSYQIQREGTQELTALFKSLLPDTRIGERPNVKSYGDRFTYMSGCKPEEGFFLFAAQFGYGFLIWGMVLGPNIQVGDSNDALQQMKWRGGGCGLGSFSP